MTSPPLPPPDEALSPEERDLAARLARLDASAGPSAALDARILAAARAAAAPRRPVRRWPTAFGAAAVLVAAVGLAWQMRPMFSLGPPPLSAEQAGAGRSGVESEVVVQVEPVRRAPPPADVVADAAAPVAPPAAARKAAPASGGIAPRAAAPRRVGAAPVAAHDGGIDEALPPTAQATAAAASPQASDASRAAEPAPPAARDSLDRVEVTGSRVRRAESANAVSDAASDARLGRTAWLARIRERRDRGDLDGARESLHRFVAAHPRVRIPRDLQPLLRDDDPWSR